MITFSEIKKLHIFRGGTPVTKAYTEDVLDKLVENYSILKESEKARLIPVAKLSHKGNQAEIAANLGVLGFGFADKIWREGPDLFADFVKVPDVVSQALKSGELSSQPSIEIYRDFSDNDGVKHGPAIGAIAFLAGEQPRVKGLKGFVEAHAEELTLDDVHCYNEEQSVDTFQLGNIPMDEEPVTEKFAELDQAIKKNDALEEVRELHWAYMDKIYVITNDDELSDDEKKAKLISLKDEYHTLLDEKMDPMIESYSDDEKFTSISKETYSGKFDGLINQLLQGVTHMNKETDPNKGKDEFAEQAELDRLRKEKRDRNIANFKAKFSEVFSSKIVDKAVALFSAVAEEKDVVLFSESEAEVDLTEGFSELANDMAKAKKEKCLLVDFSETEDTSEEPVDSFGEDPNNEKLAAAAEKYSEEHPDVPYRKVMDIVTSKSKD